MIWTTIASLFFGAVPSIVSALAKAKKDLADAKTEQDRIAAQERIVALEAKRDVLIKEVETPWKSLARFSLLTPLAVYLWWTILWDKIACKWFTDPDAVERVCSTDRLGEWQLVIFLTIVGFYFAADLTRWIKR